VIDADTEAEAESLERDQGDDGQRADESRASWLAEARLRRLMFLRELWISAHHHVRRERRNAGAVRIT